MGAAKWQTSPMDRRKILRWVVPVLVGAALVLVIRPFAEPVSVTRHGLTFATGSLARALERPGGSTETRIIMQFATRNGLRCRAFAHVELSGIACHEHGGWHLRVMREGVALDEPAAAKRTDALLRAAARRIAVQ